MTMSNFGDKLSLVFGSIKGAVVQGKDKFDNADPKVKTAGCVAVGVGTAAAATVAVPAAAAAIGFTKTGVAGASVASAMMSKTWIWGHCMWAVSWMQSIGAAGIGAKGMALAGWLGYKVTDKISRKD